MNPLYNVHNSKYMSNGPFIFVYRNSFPVFKMYLSIGCPFLFDIFNIKNVYFSKPTFHYSISLPYTTIFKIKIKTDTANVCFAIDVLYHLWFFLFIFVNLHSSRNCTKFIIVIKIKYLPWSTLYPVQYYWQNFT